jgi:hypothetical protein
MPRQFGCHRQSDRARAHDQHIRHRKPLSIDRCVRNIGVEALEQTDLLLDFRLVPWRFSPAAFINRSTFLGVGTAATIGVNVATSETKAAVGSINHRLVGGEVAGRCGFTCPCEIGRRANRTTSRKPAKAQQTLPQA